MKNKFNFTVIILIFITQFASAQFWNKNKIKGNNNYVTQKITTQSYNKINVSSAIDVEFISGIEGNIILKAEENLIEYVEIFCKNNTLTIKIRNNTNFENNKQIIVQVPVEEVSDISLSGSYNVTGSFTLQSKALELLVAGSGDMILNINTEKLNAKVAGSGNLTLKGTAKTCDFNVAGSGDLNGKKLNCQDVIARVAGSGNCSFNCQNTLKAYIVGSGDIEYTGNPEILDSKIVGSGSVEKVN